MLQIGTHVAWQWVECRDGQEAWHQAQLLFKELCGLVQNLFSQAQTGIKVLSFSSHHLHTVNTAPRGLLQKKIRVDRNVQGKWEIMTIPMLTWLCGGQ